MDIHNLVHMANRIGEFYEAMPDHPEALEGIAQHIRKFWAPRMRHQLAEHIAQQPDSGLRPIVAEALKAHQSALA